MDYSKTPVIFLAFANDADAPLRELALEQDELRNIFRQAERDGKCRIVALSAATADKVIQVFQEYHNKVKIFHFGGHSNQEELLLRKDFPAQDNIKAKNLAAFLGSQDNLELVFINGCQSAEQAEYYYQEGAKAVITTDNAIGDKAAREFARIFYQGLANGANITEAFISAEAGYEAKFGTFPRGIRFPELLKGSPWQLIPAEQHNWRLPLIKKHLTRIPSIDLDKEFLGREDDIQRLKTKLENTSKVVLMNGLGGIGKTMLAMAYVQQYGDFYDHLAWINRGEDLVVSIALNEFLADTLGLPAIKEEKLEDRFRLILNKLQQLPGQNLLVIDNAMGQIAQKEIYELLPGLPNWRVLVTSRLNLGGFNPITLETLQPEAARALFQTFYKGTYTEKELESLLKEIGYHTLTVELISKLLDKLNNLLNVSDLTEILRKKQLDDPDLQEKIQTNYSGEERGIYLHLMKAFELSNLDEEEKRLLKQFVVLPVEQYPVDKLADLLQERALTLNRTLNGLAAKSWLIRHENRSFSIHRMIQQVLDYQLHIELVDVKNLLKSMNIKMKTVRNTNPNADNFLWLPHAELSSNYFSEENGELLTELRSNIGVIFHSFGLLEKALEYHKRALNSRKNLLEDNHPDIAASYHLLGSVLRDIGHWDEALEMHEEGLHILENTAAAEDEDFAGAYNYLAMIYHDKGNIEEALEYYKKSYSITEEKLGKNHPDLSILKSNIAQVYRELGQLEKALEMHLEALNILNSQQTIDSLGLANSYNNIGLIYRDLKKTKLALKYHMDTVSIREANLPQHHPDLAAAYNNLALVLEDLEDFDKALEYYNKVPAILEPINPNHPNLAQCFSNIAGLQQKIGDLELALSYSQRSLNIREFIFKELPTHPALAQGYNNIGTIYRVLQKYDLSIQYYLKAIEILEFTPQSNQFNLATSYGNIGKAFFEIGQFDPALEFYHKAITIRERIMVPNDTRLAEHYEGIARVYEALEDHNMASHFYKKARN